MAQKQKQMNEKQNLPPRLPNYVPIGRAVNGLTDLIDEQNNRPSTYDYDTAPEPTFKQPEIRVAKDGSYKPSSVERINKNLRAEQRKIGEQLVRATEQQDAAQKKYDERSEQSRNYVADSGLKTWVQGYYDHRTDNAEWRHRKAEAKVDGIAEDLKSLDLVTNGFYEQAKDVLHDQAYQQAEAEAVAITRSPSPEEPAAGRQ